MMMMRSYGIVVIALCLSIGTFAQDSSNNNNNYYGSVREVLGLYNECSHSDGLSPCLKLKALSLIDRVSRMEKIDLMEGVVVTGKTEEDPHAPSLEEVEKSLPRAVDAKSQALTSLMFNRIAKMIGSKTISVSIPTLVEAARKKGGDDDKFSEISELLSDKFGGSGGKGGGKHGKGGKKKGGGMDMKDFFMQMMAHKLAMIPLLIGGLFILAVKALTQAKIALLIAGIIFGKKLLANKGGNGGGHVEHVQAGWSAGGGAGAGGWGGSGGWSNGGGWDRRSLEDAQNLAYKGSKQAMMKSFIVIIIVVAAFGALLGGVLAQDSFEAAGFRFILKIYDECSGRSDGFSSCLKKKAITVLDRVARMDKLPLMDGVALVKGPNGVEPAVSENEIENLPRDIESQDDALNNMLADRVNNLLGSRTIEISMPQVSELLEEGRGKGGGGGGGGKGGGKGGMNMMGGLMMAVAAKLAALIPLAIAGLFLLAGKALITAKIALLISGIIALKKLFAAKHSGHGGGWHSGGGGGWQSSGGGWDKRSIDEAQRLAYKSHYKQV
ncbi:uncharacterized protein LOC126741925 [Anthonomus grandis grandis]|uniref:uncharacterized protein LOC126741925 n=1 Tax=Anthonomus grandis grandis TaxID=2921223 RepID=UPI0021652671|nr:uncharacterized protein LOC126741925 [Anthonomus grandis grandis]